MTEDLVKKEITKRMVEIESGMKVEINLRMENSIQRTVMAMMEQLRLEKQGNHDDKNSQPDCETHASAKSSDHRSNSKKRKRKDPPPQERCRTG
jgi:hypothetical protein